MPLNLLVLSVLGGVSSFFSPCSFPLLPTYITYVARESGREGDVVYGLRIGLPASLGLVAVYGGLTLIQYLFFGALTRLYGGFLIILGLLLVVIGLINLIRYGSDKLAVFINHLVTPVISRIEVGESMLLYGVAYGLTSIACSGPILLMVATLAVSQGLAGLIYSVAPYLLSLFFMMLFFTALSTYLGYYLSIFIKRYIGLVNILFSILLIFAGIYVVLFEFGVVLLPL